MTKPAQPAYVYRGPETAALKPGDRLVEDDRHDQMHDDVRTVCRLDDAWRTTRPAWGIAVDQLELLTPALFTFTGRDHHAPWADCTPLMKGDVVAEVLDHAHPGPQILHVRTDDGAVWTVVRSELQPYVDEPMPTTTAAKLEKIRDTFADYARKHTAAGKPARAARNDLMARMAGEALAEHVDQAAQLAEAVRRLGGPFLSPEIMRRVLVKVHGAAAVDAFADEHLSGAFIVHCQSRDEKLVELQATVDALIVALEDSTGVLASVTGASYLQAQQQGGENRKAVAEARRR